MPQLWWEGWSKGKEYTEMRRKSMKHTVHVYCISDNGVFSSANHKLSLAL